MGYGVWGMGYGVSTCCVPTEGNGRAASPSHYIKNAGSAYVQQPTAESREQLAHSGGREVWSGDGVRVH